MSTKQPGTDRSKSIEDPNDLRLMTPPDALVQDNAVTRSTADLDVDHRILTARLESERLTRRMRVALDDTGCKLSRQEMLHRVRWALAWGCGGGGGNGRRVVAS